MISEHARAGEPSDEKERVKESINKLRIMLFLAAPSGGNGKNLEDLDGVSQWQHLQHGSPSPRHEMLYNIGQTF
jgi:hypothetical protein